MPAAAVIPAPIAYIKVVAVKKLVVEFWVRLSGPAAWSCTGSSGSFLLGSCYAIQLVCRGSRTVYFEKIRVFKAGLCLNTLAWNNKIGLWFYFVGF